MRKTTVLSLLLLGVLNGLKAAPASGQCFSGFRRSPATCASAYRTGTANLIQAAGDYNLNTSQAAINFETARSMDLDNQLKGTQTFFEMRRINVASRQAEEGRTMTTEEANRYAQMAEPKRLAATELDPVTGEIHWPVTLQDPRYSDFRKQLDHYFVLRETSHGRVGYENYVQGQQVLRTFLAELRSNLDEYRSDEYVATKKFLESLGSAAKAPAVSVVSLR